MLETKQLKDLSQQVRLALIVEKLKGLSPMQLQMMDQLLEEEENDPKKIINEMIVGI